jgi:hypothetical protein
MIRLPFYIQMLLYSFHKYYIFAMLFEDPLSCPFFFLLLNLLQTMFILHIFVLHKVLGNFLVSYNSGSTNKIIGFPRIYLDKNLGLMGPKNRLFHIYKT